MYVGIYTHTCILKLLQCPMIILILRYVEVRGKIFTPLNDD